MTLKVTSSILRRTTPLHTIAPSMRPSFARVRVFSLVMLLTAGCAPSLFRGDHECLPPASSAPASATQIRTLGGDYDLVIISAWEQESGYSVEGRLHLQPTDSLRRNHERSVFGRLRPVDERPLWGWAELSSSGMMLPYGADPALRDPDHPGVLVHANGQLELGVWRGNDGSSVSMKVNSVTPAGFSGTWSSDLGIVRLVDHGRVLPDPNGYFCAFRR